MLFGHIIKLFELPSVYLFGQQFVRWSIGTFRSEEYSVFISVCDNHFGLQLAYEPDFRRQPIGTQY